MIYIINMTHCLVVAVIMLFIAVSVDNSEEMVDQLKDKVVYALRIMSSIMVVSFVVYLLLWINNQQ